MKLPGESARTTDFAITVTGENTVAAVTDDGGRTVHETVRDVTSLGGVALRNLFAISAVVALLFLRLRREAVLFAATIVTGWLVNSAIKALVHVSLPLTLPSLIAAMMMVFAVASRELVTSLLLAPAGTQTISIYVWRQFEQGSIGQGMAMATIAIGASLLLMLGGLSLKKRGAL